MLRTKWFWLVVISTLGIAVAVNLVKTRYAAWSSTPRWQNIAPGMELCRLKGKTANGEVEVTAVRIDPAQCDTRVVYAEQPGGARGSWADEVCPKLGAAINASFFDESGRPLGLLIIDGEQRQRHFPQHIWGAFRVRDGRPEIVLSDGTPAKGVTQAIECKPRLVVGGKLQTFKQQAAAMRSAVGINANGQVIIAATQDFLTLEQWAACLQQEFGCVDALNLDGGPSTQLAVRGRTNVTISGSRVPVFLTFAPRAKK